MLVSGCRGEERNIAIQSIEHCDIDATLLLNGTFYFPDLFDDSLVNDSYDYEDYEDYEEPEDYREKRSTWDDEDYQYSGDYQDFCPTTPDTEISLRSHEISWSFTNTQMVFW